MMTTSNHQSWQPWAPDDLAATNTNEAEDYQAKRKELTLLRNQLLAEKKAFEIHKEQIFEEAKTQGYEEGYKAGHEKGYSEGLEQGNQVGLTEAQAAQSILTQKLTEITENFNQEFSAIKSVVPEKVMQLALGASRYLLQTQLPDLQNVLSKKIQDELEKLPIAPKMLTLKISDDDWAFISQSLKELFIQNSWKMIKDDDMVSGGFHIETDTQEIDSTLEKRWFEICKLARSEISDAE